MFGKRSMPQPLLQAREQLKNGNLKVTFNDFIIRACALALARASPCQ